MWSTNLNKENTSNHGSLSRLMNGYTRNVNDYTRNVNDVIEVIELEKQCSLDHLPQCFDIPGQSTHMAKSISAEFKIRLENKQPAGH